MSTLPLLTFAAAPDLPDVLPPRRERSKIGMFVHRYPTIVIGGVLLATSLKDPRLGAAIIAGAALGVVLGYYGLRHTQFEITAEGRFYTPHTYVGIAVTALFVGRFAFRFLKGYGDAHAAMQANANPLAAYQRSPLTLALFGLLVGYYAYFNIGVVRRSRALAGASAPAEPAG